MTALYRNRHLLPSLLLVCLACACEDEPSRPQRTAGSVPNVYLEALQEAEALRHTIEERHIEQQRIDALIGPDQAQPPSR